MTEHVSTLPDYFFQRPEELCKVNLTQPPNDSVEALNGRLESTGHISRQSELGCREMAHQVSHMSLNSSHCREEILLHLTPPLVPFSCEDKRHTAKLR